LLHKSIEGAAGSRQRQSPATVIYAASAASAAVSARNIRGPSEMAMAFGAVVSAIFVGAARIVRPAVFKADPPEGGVR